MRTEYKKSDFIVSVSKGTTSYHLLSATPIENKFETGPDLLRLEVVSEGHRRARYIEEPSKNPFLRFFGLGKKTRKETIGPFWSEPVIYYGRMGGWVQESTIDRVLYPVHPGSDMEDVIETLHFMLLIKDDR